MLLIDRKRWQNLSDKKPQSSQRSLLLLAFVLLAGGILCIGHPFTSGVVISVIIGTLLVISGLGFMMAMFSHREGNLWPFIGGLLIGIAWLILGYMFITEPLAGLVSMAVVLAALFFMGGVVRLLAGWKMREQSGGWLQLVVGMLDLALGCILISSGPAVSVVLLMTLVGIEMLFSSASLFVVVWLIRNKQRTA